MISLVFVFWRNAFYSCSLIKKHHTKNYKHGKGRGLNNGLEGPPFGKKPLEHDILILKSKEELYLIHKYG